MKYILEEDSSLLDALAKLSPESSKTSHRSWLKHGRVTVDGIPEKLGSRLLKKGQLIELGVKKQFIDEGIKILYEDKHIVVVDKPAGILSVSTAFEKGKTVHALLKDKYHPKRVFVVHRLDQDTSGIMLFALSEEARDALKGIFEEHNIERAYSGIVEGNMPPGSGTWESYLVEDGNYYVRETADPNEGRIAITHYEVHAISKKHTWLNLTLETGRKNQIRVHCSKAGHPIAGDKKYGAKSNPIKRLCLHAHLLAFTHPITHKKMRFESEVPQSFYRILKP